MLCANAARSVDDYFAYDFVGAPIAADIGNGYNGGLSLRKRSSTLRVLDEWDWETTKKEGDRFEDQWYFNRFVRTSSASWTICSLRETQLTSYDLDSKNSKPAKKKAASGPKTKAQSTSPAWKSHEPSASKRLIIRIRSEFIRFTDGSGNRW